MMVKENQLYTRAPVLEGPPPLLDVVALHISKVRRIEPLLSQAEVGPSLWLKQSHMTIKLGHKTTVRRIRNTRMMFRLPFAKPSRSPEPASLMKPIHVEDPASSIGSEGHQSAFNAESKHAFCSGLPMEIRSSRFRTCSFSGCMNWRTTTPCSINPD